MGRLCHRTNQCKYPHYQAFHRGVRWEGYVIERTSVSSLITRLSTGVRWEGYVIEQTSVSSLVSDEVGGIQSECLTHTHTAI